MLRNRLKNIINKSKEISNKSVGDSFEQFKQSLPKELEIGDNYRLKAAWKAYGSPSDYKHALWEGMICKIDEGIYKLPSIGYNEETDEYEYLNKGRDNETVAKDIRVWDNDVIPLVKELKFGGYVRTFNKEKDCWIYTKNSQKETPLGENNISVSLETSGEIIEEFKSGGKKKIRIKTIWDDYIEVDSISDDQRAGRVPIGKRNGQDLYLGGDGIAAPLNHAPSKQENGGIIDSFLKGGKSKPKFEDWYKTVPLEKNDTTTYDLEKAYNELPFEELESFRTIPEKHLDGRFKKPNHMTYSDEGYGWIGSDKVGWTFYPSPRQLQLYPYEKYVEYWNQNEPNSTLNYNGKMYRVSPQSFKQGGQMNVIPEGALHARKNNMELAKEGEITHKGVPVVDNDGVLQAEVEKEEWTMTKELTDDVEKWYKKFYSEETTEKEKEELAIECGKRIVKELLHNTDDRTGLILKLQEEYGSKED